VGDPEICRHQDITLFGQLRHQSSARTQLYKELKET
jgi:hypothetical protein